MIKNVLQCCYTNASRAAGEIISSGWQAVCVSQDLPADAFAGCTKIQNANSSIQNTMVDESGNVLNLFEICGDGAFIYVIRTQYGLLDRLGRANMFSHAYVFPCKDSNAVLDPNAFLTLANENFASNEEDAMKCADALSRLPAYKIEDAMRACGLDQARLLALTKSVYAQMADKKTAKPLYIQYDGTEEMLRAVLFCLYYALPLSLRKRLSVASVKTENTVGKNVIFSKNAKSQELYFDPMSGESAILTARLEKRISRLGFLDYAAENITRPDIQRYFKALEEKTVELGDASGANELIMKIAYLQLMGEQIGSVEDSELDTRLSDALRSNSAGNSAMDAYIARLLSEIISRKLVLTDENEGALTDRLGMTESKTLSEATEQYNFYRFNNLPTDEAAEKLSKMSAAVFTDYRKKLAASENGKKILDYYYAEILLKQVGDTWDGIQSVLDASRDLALKPLTDDKVDECAWKKYSASLAKLRSGRVDIAVTEYKNYMTIMQQRLSADTALECAAVARDAFWDQVFYSNINFTMIHSYQEMESNTDRCKQLLTYCGLPLVMLMKGDDAFFRAANAFFREAEVGIGNQYNSVAESLIMETKAQKTRPNQYFERWCRLLFSVRDSLLFEDLLNLYHSTEDAGTDEIIENFRQFAESCGMATAPFTSKKEVAQIVSAVCIKKETERNPVPLDAWLLLGGFMHINSFYIFDDIGPLILVEDETSVVSYSSLLRRREYWDCANDYIRERGREYKTVKKWLSAFQHLKRSATPLRREVRDPNKNGADRVSSATRPVQEAPRYENPNRRYDSGRVRLDGQPSTEHDADKKQPSEKKGLFSGLFGKK